MKASLRRARQDRARHADRDYFQSWFWGPRNAHWELLLFLVMAAGAAWMTGDWSLLLFVLLPITGAVWLVRWWWTQ